MWVKSLTLQTAGLLFVPKAMPTLSYGVENGQVYATLTGDLTRHEPVEPFEELAGLATRYPVLIDASTAGAIEARAFRLLGMVIFAANDRGRLVAVANPSMRFAESVIRLSKGAWLQLSNGEIGRSAWEKHLPLGHDAIQSPTDKENWELACGHVPTANACLLPIEGTPTALSVAFAITEATIPLNGTPGYLRSKERQQSATFRTPLG